MAPTPQPEDYQIAIICALGIESDAVQNIYDELYDPKDITWHKAPDDRSAYTLGRVGRYHVVLAHMPGMGKVNAANTARDIRATFPNISRGLTIVAGVCGGVPRTPDGLDIYLGDIIVSTEIQQADFGREHPSGFVVKEQSEGNLGSAPAEIRAFLHKISSHQARAKLLETTAANTLRLISALGTEPPEANSDKLFPPDYNHRHHTSAQQSCQACSSDESSICNLSQGMTCSQLGCNAPNTRLRPAQRPPQHPFVHFGPLCSTDTVKRAGISRDKYFQQYKALGFEMEGSGVWNTLPTIVVKAVCDYADSHKNKRWQEFAAINAAACCKALVNEWIPLALNVPATPLQTKSADDRLKIHQDYLQSLEFAQLGSRLHDIKFAQYGTCDWIFETSEFRSWLDPHDMPRHHGVLWIKGRPGSGKSVIMKHIRQADHLFQGSTTISYFFHARGTKLEQTFYGMLRGLLHKMLQEDPTLLNRFIQQYPRRGKESIQRREWAISELQDFLFLCIRNSWLGNTVFIIDALDECDSADARELVSLFEDLALEAMHSKSRVLICFSIRHFPNISMRYCQQLIIDNKDEHSADMKTYATRKLAAQDLVPQVLEKSQHVFLWVVLVIQILNAYHDSGSDIETMYAALEKIPMGLKAVFDLILQSNEGSREETALVLQLILYTAEPFSPRAFYFLVVIGTRPDWIDSALENSMSDEALRLFVISWSLGLLELRDSWVTWSDKTPDYRNLTFSPPVSGQIHDQKLLVVQLIHESVADYLRESQRSKGADRSAILRPAAECHASIARTCLAILCSRFGDSSLIPQTYSSVANLLAATALIEIRRYARRNISAHIEGAASSESYDSLVDSYQAWYRRPHFSLDSALMDWKPASRFY